MDNEQQPAISEEEAYERGVFPPNDNLYCPDCAGTKTRSRERVARLGLSTPRRQLAGRSAAMTPPRDEPGLRAKILAQDIIRTVEQHGREIGTDRLRTDGPFSWRADTHKLCREHMLEADRTIDQLVRNAAEMANASCRVDYLRKPGYAKGKPEPGIFLEGSE